ncbi:uncharacterized protein [Dermacentor andersoni]|uniref:uncharacterized protein isoform X1 n=1 Tax=Dermacentor andersoni TaxID=34620 RepID=UPI002416BA8C|nr:uncharacterized protein LOC126544127 isoform X1 [Dermacentor andersoni]
MYHSAEHVSTISGRYGKPESEPPYQAVVLHPRKAEKVHSSRSLPGRSTDFIASHGFSPPHRRSHENVSSTDSSNVHVQISDIAGDEDIVAITYFLKICKSTILKPYSIILQLVAWRKFRKDNPTRHHLSWRIMNVLYPAIVLMLLLFYAALQGLACPGRLEFKTMQATALRNSTTIVPKNVTVNVTPDYFWDDYNDDTTTQRYEVQSLGKLPLCQHRLTLYILPSLLQVIAFLYGSYMFRIIGVDEELYAIMEKVFLQSSAYFTERIIITITRRFLLAGIVWTVMQTAVQILYNLAVETEEQLVERAFSKLAEWKTMVLITIRILGQLAMTLVEMAVVLNYCTQCEMIIIYLRGVALRLREKRITIREGMHELLASNDYISHLNRNLGKVTALFIINFSIHALIGIFLFLLNNDKTRVVLAYRAAYPVVWIIAMFAPLYQASRVTAVGLKISKISIESRVFGYQDVQDFDLDSFVLFVGNMKLRAKMFGRAIWPSTLLFFFGGTALVVYLLVICDVLTNPVMGSFL